MPYGHIFKRPYDKDPSTLKGKIIKTSELWHKTNILFDNVSSRNQDIIYHKRQTLTRFHAMY